MRGDLVQKVGSISYFRMRTFDKSLHHAMQRGGQGKKAAVKVKAVLGNLGGTGDPFREIVTPTHHGESRIANCVKYGLGGGWRLVTCQHQKTCAFLFIGKHENVDRWLDQNRGQTFVVEDGRAALAPGFGPTIAYGKASWDGHQELPLFARIEAALADHVLGVVPRGVARHLEALDGRASSEDLLGITEALGSHEKRELIERVFNQVIGGNLDGAETSIKLDMGAIEPLDELDEEALIAVQDGSEIRRLPIGSPEYEDWLVAFEQRSTWYDWLLFLHPEQEAVVEADYLGSAQLSGVSGSGKTCVAVRRAMRLASETEEAEVLLVTLNRSLAGLLKQLVDAACLPDDVRRRIHVTSFFQLAQNLLFEFEPGNEKLYSDVTWKLNEHVDEVFREYYRQWLRFDAADVLVPLHMSMNSRGVSGERYLREEFDWIRSAVAPKARPDYLELPRRGRRFPLGREWRQGVLSGLEGWEYKMNHVGVVDYAGLTSALSRHQDRLRPDFDHVLVDEAQDFGTTELRVLRGLVSEGPNDLFLCGDVAQTILPKHRSLTAAGIASPQRARIVQNYRNSREILAAAYEVLKNNLHEDLLDSEDLEILDPRFANFSGDVPVALAADDLEEEIAYARSYAESRLKAGIKTVCIAFAGFSNRDIKAFASARGVTALDGTYDPSNDALVFSDLEQTKGYEFETMIILQCTADVLPPRDGPEEEAHRAACQLYVAMTRARRELILSFHGRASPWVTEVSDSLATDIWADVEEIRGAYLTSVPEVLPEIEPDDGRSDALLLTGAQFIYTSHSRGLSQAAQQKLSDLVDGRGRLEGGTGRRLQWPSVGALFKDLKASRLNDRLVGPVVSNELRALAGALNASGSR